MNYFNNIRLYKIIILILILLNAASIGSIWFLYGKIDFFSNDTPPTENYGPPERVERSSIFLIQELDLNEKQRELFRNERTLHFAAVRILKDSIIIENQLLLDMVFTEKADSAKILGQHSKILQLQERIESLKIQHFLKLNSFCDDEQRIKMKGLFQDLFIKDKMDGKRGQRQARKNRH